MAIYDPSNIQEHAQRLYVRATATTVLGCGLGASLGILQSQRAGLGAPYEVAIVALVGAALGGGLGRMYRHHLRFRAQEALCQVQIEENTRNRPPPIQ